MINIIENMKNVGSGYAYDGINARIFKSTYMAIINQLVHCKHMHLYRHFP